MDSFTDVWEGVCDYCKSHLTDVGYKLWISEMEPVGFSEGTVYLYARSVFHKKVVLETELFKNTLENGFESVLGFKPPIVIVTPETNTLGYVPQKAVNKSMPPEARGEIDPSTNSDGRFNENEYTFENFIVGSSNKFAHAAAQAVAANPAGIYNPLFIHGESGLGKTHLLYAIANEVKKTRPATKIIYVKGDEFTNELIEAIRGNSTSYFHEKYRNVDILLVDDIQFIAGKDSTQEEFFHTFNNLYQAGKQIVLTSDRPPKEIQTLEDRLRTRFEWGLLADIQSPDLETRIAIVKRKAETLNLDLPFEVCEYIAQRLKNNIRQLEGAVKKMRAYYFLAGEEPSILTAQKSISYILSDAQPLPITVDMIVREVARTFMVSPEDLKSKKRDSPISEARQVAIYVVHKITSMTYKNLGKEFGRDHSTIVYSLKQVENNMNSNPKFKATVQDIIKNIKDR